jgi:hypothetical protein
VNAEEIVADEPLKETEDNRARASEVGDAFAPLESAKSRFGALLKAIEHWVQTR